MKNLLSFIFCLTLTIPCLASAEEIKLGCVVCLSGACAPDGDATVKGATLAVEEINQQGGINGKQLKLLVEDSNEAVSAASAVSAFRKLMAEDVKIFIGPSWSTAGVALAQIANKEDIILATTSGGLSQFHTLGKNIFNIRGTDKLSTESLAKEAYKLGYRKFALIGSDQPWENEQAETFRETFKKLGGEISAYQITTQTTPTTRAEVMNVIQSKPEAIFLSAFTQSVVTTRELKELGFTGLLITPYYLKETLSLNPSGFEGSLSAHFTGVSENFRYKYQKRWNLERVELAAPVSYDAIKLFAKLIKVYGLNAKLIAENLLKANHQGESGNFSFTPDGSAIRVPEIVAIYNATPSKYEASKFKLR